MGLMVSFLGVLVLASWVSLVSGCVVVSGLRVVFGAGGLGMELNLAALPVTKTGFEGAAGIHTAAMLFGVVLHASPRSLKSIIGEGWQRVPAVLQAVVLVTVLVVLQQIQASGGRPFIYFQF